MPKFEVGDRIQYGSCEPWEVTAIGRKHYLLERASSAVHRTFKEAERDYKKVQPRFEVGHRYKYPSGNLTVEVTAIDPKGNALVVAGEAGYVTGFRADERTEMVDVTNS